jgi:hypothetical protein
MITKIADTSAIAIGDNFFNIVDGGRFFHEGTVDGFDAENVTVDYEDFRVRYDRIDCALYEEHCGYIRSYYACTSKGDVIERFV